MAQTIRETPSQMATASSAEKITLTKTLLTTLKTTHPKQYAFIQFIALTARNQLDEDRSDDRLKSLSKSLEKWGGPDIAKVLIRSYYDVFPDVLEIESEDVLAVSELKPPSQTTNAIRRQWAESGSLSLATVREIAGGTDTRQKAIMVDDLLDSNTPSHTPVRNAEKRLVALLGKKDDCWITEEKSTAVDILINHTPAPLLRCIFDRVTELIREPKGLTQVALLLSKVYGEDVSHWQQIIENQSLLAKTHIPLADIMNHDSLIFHVITETSRAEPVQPLDIRTQKAKTVLMDQLYDQPDLRDLATRILDDVLRPILTDEPSVTISINPIRGAWRELDQLAAEWKEILPPMSDLITQLIEHPKFSTAAQLTFPIAPDDTHALKIVTNHVTNPEWTHLHHDFLNALSHLAHSPTLPKTTLTEVKTQAATLLTRYFGQTIDYWKKVIDNPNTADINRLSTTLVGLDTLLFNIIGSIHTPDIADQLYNKVCIRREAREGVSFRLDLWHRPSTLLEDGSDSSSSGDASDSSGKISIPVPIDLSITHSGDSIVEVANTRRWSISSSSTLESNDPTRPKMTEREVHDYIKTLLEEPDLLLEKPTGYSSTHPGEPKIPFSFFPYDHTDDMSMTSSTML
jgi:hypothetical protein